MTTLPNLQTLRAPWLGAYHRKGTEAGTGEEGRRNTVRQTIVLEDGTEDNRIGRTRDLFQKIRNIGGNFQAKMGMIKNKDDRDLTEAEEIKKRWQEYTEDLYRKDNNIEDSFDSVVSELELDILRSKVEWALRSIANNKATGDDGIPAELFKILEGDAVKVMHAICQQIWKTQDWPSDWKKSMYIPIPKKGNAKECSNFRTVALISHASKVMLKILQGTLQL
ncbi:uncharacterized protein LOC134295881 [Anolis carolinensis]|uniref:uncharacterized protein LOC134295881 n=1 Tax=Anolis carolinensis TaxID=28377 RepID=UPI002F2B88C8